MKCKKWEYISIRQHSMPLGGGIYYLLPSQEKDQKYSGDSDWKNVHNLLNHFGNEGYELVEAATSSTNAGVYVRMWVMKRPKP
jgi:hypothetical protein